MTDRALVCACHPNHTLTTPPVYLPLERATPFASLTCAKTYLLRYFFIRPDYWSEFSRFVRELYGIDNVPLLPPQHPCPATRPDFQPPPVVDHRTATWKWRKSRVFATVPNGSELEIIQDVEAPRPSPFPQIHDQLVAPKHPQLNNLRRFFHTPSQPDS